MARPIEFPFLLEELEGFNLNIETKPMFGARGVYANGKIVFIMRDRETSVADNGVWIATTAEHHASLSLDFPTMRSIELFGPGPTGWQVLPVESEDFEESVVRACRLVRAGDPRIGKISARRLTGKKKPKKTLKPARKANPKTKPAGKSSLKTKTRKTLATV